MKQLLKYLNLLVNNSNMTAMDIDFFMKQQSKRHRYFQRKDKKYIKRKKKY